MAHGVIDFHSHTFWSDGCLVPAEHLVRAHTAGYAAVCITDHADYSNLELIIRNQLNFAVKSRAKGAPLPFLVGVELTHNPPVSLNDLVTAARSLGAEIVLVHGETIAEPVPEGTNTRALKAGVDILAHPGLLTEGDARLAADKGIVLEITSKKGHSLTNGHVLKMARAAGAKYVLNSDTHDVPDFYSPAHYERVGRGAGMTPAELDGVRETASALFQSLCRRKGLDY